MRVETGGKSYPDLKNLPLKDLCQKKKQKKKLAMPHSVTVLRHPVKRIVSEYNYILKSLPQHPARVFILPPGLGV